MTNNNYLRIIIAGIILMLLPFLSYAGQPEARKENRIIFPRGISVNVGQVGWMEGSSLDDTGGPWRAGIRRNFDVRDYKPIVEVGEELGVRFMTLFILGEFDRLNILSEYPTSNPAGNNWDNSEYIGTVQLEVMDYVKKNAAHMEFGLTGVLHEYWEKGIKSRAEWFNVKEQKPRDEKVIRSNIELIKRIMSQYGITPERGHSFPESFISYGFYFNPGSDYSLGKVLSENGVKYANTPFATIHGLKHPPLLDGGFDNGVILLDRFNHGNLWYEYATLPKWGPDSIKTVVVESHWANWLAFDDHLQPELNNRWKKYLRSIQAHPDYYLSKNTEQLYSQWLYKKFTTVNEVNPGKVLINNQFMPKYAYDYNLLGNMVLAVKLAEGEHISQASIDGKPIAAYYEAEGFGYIYLPPLKKQNHKLDYQIGNKKMDRFVYNTGTYNIYNVREQDSALEIDIKMYGEQIVEIYSSKPSSVTSSNDHLEIKSFSFDNEKGTVYLIVKGRDIQGERGLLRIELD